MSASENLSSDQFTYEHIHGEPMSRVMARVEGQRVGNLHYDNESGEIETVQVKEPYRRQGVATEMLNLARRHHPGVRHSDTISPDAEAWAAKTQ